MRSGSLKTSFVSQTLAIAALFLGASNTLANAAPADRITFREFRQQNEGIARNSARRMFHQQFGRMSNSGQLHAINPYQNVITVGPDGQAVCGGGFIDRNRHVREPRVRNVSVQALSNGGLTRVNRGVDLDLSSTDKNIVLGSALFGTTNGASIEVSVGGKTSTFQAGSVVTAAEYVAVKQALNGGQQVQLDRSGRAIGGSVDLGSLTSGNTVMKASNLVIPENVTTYGDFGKGSDFRLTGELSNFGTVQVLSSDRSIHGGSIRANDISNHSGALISSTVDLHLNTDRNLTNYGSILSTESLSLSAGGQLNNAGQIASNGDLNVNSSAVTNSGVMSSSTGNVNLGSSADLAVNNYKGTISAVNGAINVRDAAYTGSNNSYINGGDLISRELNLNSGLGTTNVDVNQLTGVINGTGTASHVTASTDMLNVGNVCLTGDPTFYNVSGGIRFLDNVMVQEDLVLIAAGAITSVDNVTIRAGDATKGYNITFISGASITAVSGGNSNQFVGPISGPPYPDSGTVTISKKASKLNGAGTISFGDGVLISSRSTDTAADHNGGNISFFAFGKTGLIDTFGARIESGGQKLGTNGDVTFVNGGKSETQPTIVTAAIDTTNQVVGTEGTGGKISVVTAAPIIVNGTSVTYDDKGALVGPSFLAAGTKLAAGDVVFALNPALIGGSDINAAGIVKVDSGNTLQIGNTLTAPEVQLNSGFAQRTFSAGQVIAPVAVITTGKKGFVGTGPNPGDGMAITTDSLTVQSPSGNAAFTLGGTGVIQVNSSGSSTLLVDAPTREIQGTVSATSQLLLRGDKLNPTGQISSGGTLTLVSTQPLLNTDANQYSAQTLILSVNSVGTSEASPFQINSAVKEVDLFFVNSEAFLQSNASKSIVIGDVDITGNLTFRSNTGITLGVDSQSKFQTTGGFFDIATASGTMAIAQGVNISAITAVTLENDGITSKDKITFGANSKVSTANVSGAFGFINIGVGTIGAPLTPTFTNPTLTTTGTGTINFFGTGLSAKGAQSAISADNTSVNIYNSVGAKNINLGGNVQINASSL